MEIIKIMKNKMKQGKCYYYEKTGHTSPDCGNKGQILTEK